MDIRGDEQVPATLSIKTEVMDEHFDIHSRFNKPIFID